MNVTFNGGQASFLNVNRISQSIIGRNGNHSSEQPSRAERRDKLTISPQGKRNSLLESLMNKKANITEQKNALISSTLENGGTLETIKSQLENYDEQMKTIETQITELMAKEMEKQTEKTEKQQDSKPKTEEEIQNERLANVASLSSDLKQSEVIRSVQTKVDGNARVLKSEIELDKGRAGAESITKKETALAGMEQKSLYLTSKISEKLSDTSASIENLNKPQEIFPDEEMQSKTEELYATDKSSTDISKDKKLEKSFGNREYPR